MPTMKRKLNEFLKKKELVSITINAVTKKVPIGMIAKEVHTGEYRVTLIVKDVFSKKE